MGFDHGKLQDFVAGRGARRRRHERGVRRQRVARHRRAGRRPSDADRRRAHPRPVLRPQRDSLRLDGGARVVVPAALRRAGSSRRPRTSACGWSSTALDTFATIWLERRGARPATPTCSARPSSTSTGLLQPGASTCWRSASTDRSTTIAGKTLSAWGRNPERSADAQGPVRLRLGLGSAPADDRRLAAGRAAPRAPRRARRASTSPPST